MNTVNARYGNDPGIKAYTHVNDRFAPFASRTIPATVSEALYLLDGLTMNKAGRRIEEQYADTGGCDRYVDRLATRQVPCATIAPLPFPSRRRAMFVIKHSCSSGPPVELVDGDGAAEPQRYC